MIKCTDNNSDSICVYDGQCCIECDAQMQHGRGCSCCIAEDLSFDKGDVLKYCQYAKEID